MIGKPTYTDTELLLLTHLRNNGRMTLTEMSEKIGVPVSTLHDKFKAQDLIVRQTCLLDYERLGYSTKAYLLIKVKKENRIEAGHFLLPHHHVNSLCKINNGYDFLLEGIFRNIRELEEFLDDLDKRYCIKAKEIIYIIEELGNELFLSREEHIAHVRK